MHHQTIFDYLADHVRERSGHPVYLYEGRSFNFGTIEAESARCRAALLTVGVGPGDRVAVLMNDCPDMIVVLLGVMGIGAIAVPCCTVLSPDELAYVLQDSGACCAIVGSDQWSSMDAVRSRLPMLGSVLVAGSVGGTPAGVIDFDQALSRARPAPLAALSAETPAFIIYTSGSTGRPKGALHRHGDIPVTVEAMARDVYEMSSDERLYSRPPALFRLRVQQQPVLPAGHRRHLHSDPRSRDSPDRRGYPQRYRADDLLGVPKFGL